jgi:serine/threonine-protein kinase
VVLYELLTGRRPFGGSNYNATLRAIIEDEPAPAHTFLAGDAALSGILERGLRKDRSERWPSMKALGTALAEWLLGRGIEEDVTRASLRSLWSITPGDEAPWSVPPVAVPAPGAPPSASLLVRAAAATPGLLEARPASPRAASESSTIDELDARFLSELETISVGSMSTERSGRGLSTNGHGAVSVTRGGRRRSGARLMLGGLAVALAGVIGWASMRAARLETPVAASGAFGTSGTRRALPETAPVPERPKSAVRREATPPVEQASPKRRENPDKAAPVAASEPVKTPRSARAERAAAESSEQRTRPAREPASRSAAVDAPAKTTSGEGSSFRPRGL